ncbi:hypothetical protein [Microcoleus sp. D2_18a_B4]|uniref:hypothetical protein n=1 Tax=Microcoleus sp. D2_18a_B4 TaxID=3055329 RepID=UPI002FCFB7EB
MRKRFIVISRKKEEGSGKKEEGRRKREEGRGKKEEGRRQRIDITDVKDLKDGREKEQFINH